MSKRFVIEGEWSGYTSAQKRIAHRSVHPGGFYRLRTWAEKTYGIRYSDGTQLLLTVRDCKPRERVKVIPGYLSLIKDCAHFDVNSVEALPRATRARRDG